MDSENEIVDGAIKFSGGDVNLEPAPINPDWILEGNPVTRSKLVSSSADGNASTWLWDCIAGNSIGSRALQIARRIYRPFQGLVGGGNGSTSPAMFQNR